MGPDSAVVTPPASLMTSSSLEPVETASLEASKQQPDDGCYQRGGAGFWSTDGFGKCPELPSFAVVAF